MKIKSKTKNYTLEFRKNILTDKNLFKNKEGQNYFYLIDKNVYKIYRKQLDSIIGKNKVIIIPANEKSKSFRSLSKIYHALINNGLKRKDTLVTFGGGVLQDASGFVASTIFRGVKWVFFPTTLLAQADSCIGSKTSINFKESKNLIGTFFPPDKIYLDTNFLKTLKDKYFYSGVGEIIKTHLMATDKEYRLLRRFLSSPNLKKSRFLKKIIKSALLIKKSYFEGDEYDSGKRNLLNYGHCFGHALESASNFKVPHGQAVIVGIGFANLLSLERGLMNEEKYNEFENILQKYYPPFNLSKIKPKDIIYYLKCDKKRVGKDLTMILSSGIGKQKKYNDIKESEVKKAYNKFLKVYPKNSQNKN